MAKLKATRSILYLNRIYEAGEELPYYDEATVKAWIEAKSAVWEDEASDRANTTKSADTTPGEDTLTMAQNKKPASRAATTTKTKRKTK